MILCDTHSHIFDDAFDADRAEVVRRATESGVERIILPAIDSESHSRLIDTLHEFPEVCRGAMGVHPTSLTAENVEAELEEVRRWLDSGEDIVREMYWDIADAEVGTLNFDAPEPSRQEKGLLSKMPAGEAISMDELCERCGVSRGELSIMLVELEMDGAVRRLPGDSYIKL